MRIVSVFYSGFILLLLACGTTQVPKSVSYLGYSVSPKIKADTALINLIQPYSVKVNSTMNDVIGFTPVTLTKRLPESGLGNFMADCMREMAEQKFGKKVDAAFINYGGIRSYIPKGDITVGKIYELMPFDNLIVLQEVKGSAFKLFLNRVAEKGGWPLSGMTMKIKDKKPEQILIAGKPIDENAIYIIANSDYIANGGDDCDMLKVLPQINKGFLLRDALIQYIVQVTKQGKPIDWKVEGRVTY